MSRIIQSLVMPQGWHFMQGEVRIEVPTYDDLIPAIRKYRLDMRMEVGDVEADLEAYVCGNFPHMCHAVPGAHVTVTVELPSHITDVTKLTDDIIKWMDGQLRNHSSERLELPTEAQRRGDICVKCPMNIKWKTGCGDCVAAVNQLSTMLRSGQDLVKGRKLFACQVLRHENRSAVWLRLDGVGTDPSLPDHCWAKR